ncbi:MAG TPA: integrase core domain-containing protein [Gammaproteobacteria bacterium]
MLVEVIALRHQLEVLQRESQTPVRLTRFDRIFWVLLYRLRSSCLGAVVVVKPDTVVRWHRKGSRLFWTWKSRPRKRGRPTISADVKALVRRMSRENPLWGAPRIHGELLKLGIGISQTAVSKYMIRHPKPPSQTWRTFLRNHACCLAGVDFFVVPTFTFRLLFVFIVLHHERRHILHFGVATHPSSLWASQQIREALPWDTAPRYLIRDRDGSYGTAFRSRLQAMGVEEVLIAPRSPWQNAYAERVIGSIRRECLDHVIVLNEGHLRQILQSYLNYYHGSRTHLSLSKDCPEPRRVQPPGPGRIIAFAQVGGLHHRYERLAA